MECLVHQVLAGSELLLLDSGAVVSNQLVLGASVIADGLLNFSNQYSASVEAKIGGHNFYNEIKAQKSLKLVRLMTVKIN